MKGFNPLQMLTTVCVLYNMNLILKMVLLSNKQHNIKYCHNKSSI